MKFAMIAATALLQSAVATTVEETAAEQTMQPVEEANEFAEVFEQEPFIGEDELAEGDAETFVNDKALDQALEQLTPEFALAMSQGAEFTQSDINNVALGLYFGQLAEQENQPAYLTLAEMVTYDDMMNPDFELSQEQLQELADKHFGGDVEMAQWGFFKKIGRGFKKAFKKVKKVAKKVGKAVVKAGKTVVKYVKKCQASTICSTIAEIGISAAVSMIPGGAVVAAGLKAAKAAKYGYKAYKLAKYGMKAYKVIKKGRKVYKMIKRGSKYIKYAKKAYKWGKRFRKYGKYVKKGYKIYKKGRKIYKKAMKIYRRVRKVFCKGHKVYIKAKKVYKHGKAFYVNVIKGENGQEEEAPPNTTQQQLEGMAARVCRKSKSRRGRSSVKKHRRGRRPVRRHRRGRRSVRRHRGRRGVRRHKRRHSRRGRRHSRRRHSRRSYRRHHRRGRRLAEMTEQELGQAFSSPYNLGKVMHNEMLAELEEEVNQQYLSSVQELVQFEDESTQLSQQFAQEDIQYAEEADTEESEDEFAEESSEDEAEE